MPPFRAGDACMPALPAPLAAPAPPSPPPLPPWPPPTDAVAAKGADADEDEDEKAPNFRDVGGDAGAVRRSRGKSGLKQKNSDGIRHPLWWSPPPPPLAPPPPWDEEEKVEEFGLFVENPRFDILDL